MIEETKNRIVHLMISVAQNNRAKAELELEQIRALIYQGLDTTVSDEELVTWGKYLKIVDELESKLV